MELLYNNKKYIFNGDYIFESNDNKSLNHIIYLNEDEDLTFETDKANINNIVQSQIDDPSSKLSQAIDSMNFNEKNDEQPINSENIIKNVESSKNIVTNFINTIKTNSENIKNNFSTKNA